MRIRGTLGWLLFAVAAGVPLSAERPYINDKKAPEDRRDLEEIQKHARRSLPAARRATVCLELGGEGGSGSGVVVSEDGLILTAAHVTGGVGRDLDVRLADGRKVKAVSLGLDSETDAAMARIVDEGSYEFIRLDREEGARLGDWVFALGHSGGFDEARGAVFRLGRLVRISEATLQSDCDLIGGDSGGPLFDLSGQLVGIHSRVGSRLPENMHVPVSEFIRQWDRLLAEEFIGDGPFAERPKEGAAYLGLLTKGREEGGLEVTRVGRESPAEAAGIREGDVILSLDGVALESREQLKELLAGCSPGERVAFEMLREGKTEVLTLRLGDRED